MTPDSYSLTPEDKELLRHALLKELADRHPNAVPQAGLLLKLRGKVICQIREPDLVSALAMLKDLGLAESVQDPLGSSIWWRATAAGVIATERAIS